VTDGIRTRDIRDHNPVLYLLSYGHHDVPGPECPGARRRPMIAVSDGALSTGMPAGAPPPRAHNPAAISLDCATSGPGSGTNTVRR
jgi:hypothetical protein